MFSWFGGTYGKFTPQPGSTHEFPLRCSKGELKVTEEGALPHSPSGSTPASRARCAARGAEYDIWRLCVTSDSKGGLVPLRDLLALEHQSGTLRKLAEHKHVIRCYGEVVENLNSMHCRILLCEPCVGSLASHMSAKGGSLPASEVREVGQQLSQGLEFLHESGLMCGSLSPAGVVLGMDGVWKLGDFRQTVKFPVDLDDWREAHGADADGKDQPPEARPGTVSAGEEGHVVDVAADSWMLGVLLATALLSVHPFEGADNASVENSRFLVKAEYLRESLSARLLLLIQWLLTADPASRISMKVAAARLKSLECVIPETLLREMSRPARTNAKVMIENTARQLAFETCPRSMLDRIYGASLGELSTMIPVVGRLCRHCGIDCFESGKDSPSDDEGSGSQRSGHSTEAPQSCDEKSSEAGTVTDSSSPVDSDRSFDADANLPLEAFASFDVVEPKASCEVIGSSPRAATSTEDLLLNTLPADSAPAGKGVSSLSLPPPMDAADFDLLCGDPFSLITLSPRDDASAVKTAQLPTDACPGAAHEGADLLSDDPFALISFSPR